MSKPGTRRRARRKLKIQPAEDDIPPSAMVDALDRGGLDRETSDHYLRVLEKREEEALERNGVPDYLYPPLTDPNFNSQIVNKKEFADLRSDTRVYDPEKRAEQLCKSTEFELLPHQAFIRNFLSFRTPYNGMLLFHGLGTGKTCSAISVTEEMRLYLKQIGESKRVIVVASPNVQENFRRQLFDERKLKKTAAGWTLKACSGEAMLQEINPAGMTGLDAPTIVRLVKQIIRRSYLFMGPEQFSNYISRVMERYARVEDASERERLMSAGIKQEFSNRLLVIDEVHNIRIAKDGPQGLSQRGDKVAKYLQELVRHTVNLKLLLMSATPMFNSPEEVIWLINLMRINDKRPPLRVSDVFSKEGSFQTQNGVLIGRENLARAARGYVSYVRGDNPYAFPFKIFPAMFAPDRSLATQPQAETQLNGGAIVQPIQYLDLYVTRPEGFQLQVYRDAVAATAGRIAPDKGIGYQALNMPLQALDVVFPSATSEQGRPGENVGRAGLQGAFVYDPETKRRFAYRHDVIEQHGRFLALAALQNYSAKMKAVADAVLASSGIVLVYSQYIDGGCLPMALILEELGFRRAVGPSLFDEPPTEPRDALTMKVGATETQAAYAMITGDQLLSPDNAAEVKRLTNAGNANGLQVKVAIISEAGSEGIDLTNIRQVHILDPWYNLNRLEQIVGRAVRWCSHSSLPFAARNVEIRYYGSVLEDHREEAADVYLYRLAERKAVRMGAVTRTLKEHAVDCALNKSILTPERLGKTVKLSLSSGKTIDYVIGDRARTSLCDFMDDCAYKCQPDVSVPENPTLDTYTAGFVTMNIGAVEKRVVDVFATDYAVSRGDLVGRVNAKNDYPLVQVDAAITRVLGGGGPPVVDMLGRPGRIINIGEYYLFQPADLASPRISMYERRVPIPDKPVAIPLAAARREVAATDSVERLFARLSKKHAYTERQHDYQKLNWQDLPQSAKGDPGAKAAWGKLAASTSTAEYRTLGEVQKFYREVQSELDWHKMLGNALLKPHRLAEAIALTREDVLRYSVDHVLDVLPLDEKLGLYTYLAAGGSERSDFATGLFAGFVRRTVASDGDSILVLGVPRTASLAYYDVGSGVPVPATPVQRIEVSETLAAQPKLPLARLIGIMTPTKAEGLVFFKIRDPTKPRAQGYRCDQKGKRDAIAVLNNVLGKPLYADRQGKPRNAKELCVDEELLLRHYDTIAHEGSRWFLSLEETIRTNSGRSR